MSTDQTTPSPASVTLPGSTSVAGPDERTGQPGPVQSPEQSIGSVTMAVPTADPADTASGLVEPAGTAPGPIRHSSDPIEPADRSSGSSWRAEAAGELVAMSFPGARRIAGWLFWVVFPLLCIGAIHASVTKVVHHLGNKPVGIRGTFVVQPRSCSQGFCSFGGLFTSDDGTIKNLPLLGDPRWHTAEVHKVTYDPRSVEVTPLPGRWNPTPSVMAVFGALTYLVAIGYFFRQRRRSGRDGRLNPATRDPVPIR